MRTFPLIKSMKSLLLCFLVVALAFPENINAAELLQIRSASLLQIGDQNRSYTVQLACLEVDSSDEVLAVNWLKSELPRGSRVNLRPIGSKEGILLAKVIPIGAEMDLSESLVSRGLGHFSCSN